MEWKGLDTREWAAVFWLTVLLVAGLATPFVRRAFDAVPRVFFGSWKLVASFGAFLGWIVVVCYVGSLLGVWNAGLVPDTVAWVLASGFALVMSANRAAKEEHFFRRAALEALGLSAFMQFVLNLHTFNFAIELLLLPAVTFLFLLEAVAGGDAKTRPAQNLVNWLIAIVGLWIAIATVRGLVASWRLLDPKQAGIELAFSIWFPLTVLPFVYLLALVMEYERVLTRRWFRDDGMAPPLGVKMAILAGLLGDLRAVGDLPQHHAEYRELIRSSTYREARESIDEYKRARQERRQEAEDKAARLVQNAGVKGQDSAGKVLDQREIEETKKALRWIETCHLGHYNTRGRYRQDLMKDVLLDDFTRQGLPEEHGITMRVRKDGQAWYAWRRTPSGQVLGIGMSKGRTYEWLYDGAEPPKGYPGSDPTWADYPDEEPPNWDVGS